MLVYVRFRLMDPLDSLAVYSKFISSVDCTPVIFIINNIISEMCPSCCGSRIDHVQIDVLMNYDNL